MAFSASSWDIRRWHMPAYIFLFGIFPYCGGYGQCDDVLTDEEHYEYGVLMSIYNSTGGENWSRNDGWGEDCNYCEWYGVSCGGGKVRLIELENNNLSGSLPSSLQLEELRRLNLSNNNLSGSFSNVSGSINLYSITISNNQFSGAFPEIHSVPELKYILASYNNFTNIDNIFGLDHLWNVSFDHNSLSGELSDGFFGMTDLRYLSLNSNKLSGPLPESLGDLNVFGISLANNQFTGGIPSSYSQIPELYDFFITNNQLSGCFDESLLSQCNGRTRIFTGGNCFFREFYEFCEDPTCQDLEISNSLNNEAGCEKDWILLETNAKRTWDFKWSDGSTRYYLRDRPEETTLYSLTVTNNSGCTFYDEFEIKVIPSEEVEIQAEICAGDAYYVGDKRFRREGSYEIRLSSSSGCDSTVYLDLTVKPEPEIEVEATICRGEEFTYLDNSYSEAGVYRIRNRRFQCDTTIFLYLDVIDPVEQYFQEEICAGEEIYFNNSIYDESGVYESYFQTMDGCDSIITIDLTVLPPLEKEIDLEICQGGVFEYTGQTFDESGDYSFMVPGPECDTTIFLVLEVNDPAETFLEEIICFSESYSVGIRVFDRSGRYTIRLKTAEGCDSLVYLDLQVLPEKERNLRVEICEGDLFFVEGVPLEEEGFHEVVVKGQAGCDSLIKVDLSLVPAYSEYFSIELCPDESITVGDRNYSRGGFYEIYLPAQNGCDSLIAFDIIALEEKEVYLEKDLCGDRFFSFNGQLIISGGDYLYTTSGSNGCDSTTYLYVYEESVDELFLEEHICEGEEFVLGTFSTGDPGQYEFFYDNGDLCPAVVYLTLFVDPSGSIYTTFDLCEGDSLTYKTYTYYQKGLYPHESVSEIGCLFTEYVRINPLPRQERLEYVELCPGEFMDYSGSTITEPGLYTYRFLNQAGCDSIIYLEVNPSTIPYNEIQVQVCPGDSYIYLEQTYLQGSYEISHGCDSVTYLEVVEKPISTSRLDVQICAEDYYLFVGDTLRYPGFYNRTLTNKHNCDSIITLNLQVLEKEHLKIEEDICLGEMFSFFDRNIHKSGTYLYEEISSGVCSTVHELVLKVNIPDTTFLHESFCPGNTFLWHGQTITESGTYTTLLQNSQGCDSLLILEIEFPETTFFNEHLSGCHGDTILWAGITITESGIYQKYYLDRYGCDSIHLAEVDLQDQLQYQVETTLCPGEVFSFHGKTYDESGTYTEIIKGAFCDTTYTIVVNGTSIENTFLEQSICSGEELFWNNQTLSDAGTYEHVLTNRLGCDSVVLLELSVTPADSVFINKEICAGEFFSFYNKELVNSGNYTHSLINSLGCDSVINLRLSVLPILETIETETICYGDTLLWNGEYIYEAGNYQKTIPGPSGCDMLVMVELTVMIPESVQHQIQLCPGEVFTFHGNTYDQPGIYAETIKGPHCDTTYTIVIERPSIEKTFLEHSICSGEELFWNNQTLSDAGTYEHVLTNRLGCDSVVLLELSVTHADSVFINEEICAGDFFPFYNRELVNSGNYTHTLKNSSGCDSVINLHLFVLPVLETRETKTICYGDSLFWNGEYLHEAGNYQKTIPGTNGCDMRLMLELSVLKPDSIHHQIQLCSGEGYTFFNQYLTAPGTYFYQEPSLDGCVVNHSLILSTIETDTTYSLQQICAGEKYVYGSVLLSEAGTYIQQHQNALGCDSFSILSLEIESPFLYSEQMAACKGDIINWQGEEIIETGVYTQNYLSSQGCDSILELQVVFFEQYKEEIVYSLCAGTAYSFAGKEYLPGQYSVVVPGEVCDSVFYLDLIAAIPDTVYTSALLCPEESYYWFDTLIESPGTYNWTLTNLAGCDSTIILIVDQIRTDSTFIKERFCEDEIFFFGEEKFDQAGRYILKLTSEMGCDSTVVLDLFAYENPLATIQVSGALCPTASPSLAVSFDGDFVQWSNGFSGPVLDNVVAGEYFATITSDQGCTQVLSTIIEETPIPVINNIEISPPDSCQGISGKISIDSESYLYSLDNGDNWHNNSIPVHSPGEYFLSVASLDKACVWDEFMPITIPKAPGIFIDNVIAADNTNCITPNGFIEFLMSAENDVFLEYSIDNGNTFFQEPFFDQLSGGKFNLQVRSKNKVCLWEYETEVVINDPETVNAEVEVIQPILCEGANSGILQTNMPSGTTILWSTGDSVPYLSGLKSGGYSLTIVNEHNCRSESEVILEEGPKLEEWTLPPDTTICKGDTIWIEAPTTDLNYRWQGSNDFVLEENRVGIFLGGQYTFQLEDNEWCPFTDELFVIQEVQDFSGVDFLISEEGLVGKPITAIDITWPIADYSKWIVSDSNIHIINQLENQLILEFLQEGKYQVGLESYIGNCSTVHSKTINIYNDVSQLQNQENHVKTTGKIQDFTLFPNPNFGQFKTKIILNQKSSVLLLIVDHMGNRIHSVTQQGESSYIWDFSIESETPGIYALILITENEERYILFNKI